MAFLRNLVRLAKKGKSIATSSGAIIIGVEVLG